MMNLILAVSHFIHLNREQRNALNKGEEVEVIGISVPVWSYNKKSSEPAYEVFCKYKITPTECDLSIKHHAKGYNMLLPKRRFNPTLDRSNPVSIDSLMDFKEGGVEWLAFRQFNEVKRSKKNITIAHFVEIKDIEELMQTMA